MPSYAPPATVGTPIKAPPCAECGTTEGRPYRRGRVRPGRCNGVPVGLKGIVCLHCWDKARARKTYQEHRERKLAAGKPLMGETEKERDEVKARIAMVREESVIPRYETRQALIEQYPVELRPLATKERGRVIRGVAPMRRI